MRNMLLAATLLTSVAMIGQAEATGSRLSLDAYIAAGGATTQGGAFATSAGPGSAESFGAGAAGITLTRNRTTVAATGWQDNQAGSLTSGNGFGAGASTGAATVFGARLGATGTGRLGHRSR